MNEQHSAWDEPWNAHKHAKVCNSSVSKVLTGIFQKQFERLALEHPPVEQYRVSIETILAEQTLGFAFDRARPLLGAIESMLPQLAKAVGRSASFGEFDVWFDNVPGSEDVVVQVQWRLPPHRRHELGRLLNLELASG
jgi:hypothetical protein